MKKNAKILSLTLAVILLLSLLSACGQSGDKDAQESANPLSSGGELVWSAAFTPVSLPEGFYAGSCVYSDGGWYVEDWDSELDGGRYVIYRISPDGTAELLGGYSPEQPEEGRESSGSINAMAPAPNGGIVVFELLYSYTYDLPEDFNEETDNLWEYETDSRQERYIRWLDFDGTEIQKLELSQYLDSEDFYASSMAVGSDGAVYIASDSAVYCFSVSDGLVFKADFGNYILDLLTLPDGRTAAVGFTSEGKYAVRPIDPAAKGFGKTLVSLDTYPDEYFDGSGDFLFFYTDGGKLYGVSAGTGEASVVVDLLDCDVDSSYLESFVLTGENEAVGVLADHTDDAVSVVSFSKVPASEVQQKTVLTLGTVNMQSEIRSLVLNFNRSSDKYRVKIVDYGEFNDDGGENPALQRLNNDIISGNAPDILDMTNLPFSRYAASGLLTDLYDLLDADAEISRDGFVPGVLSALETDGALYCVCPSFSVVTACGNADKIGAEPGWTFSELKEIFDAQPEGTELLDYGYTRDNTLMLLCIGNLERFIDWENKTCSFDSQDFIDVLNLAATSPESYDYGDNYEDTPARLSSGRQLISMVNLSDFSDLQMYNAMLGGNASYKGFPVSEGVGNYISPTGAYLAITSNCKDRDGAWSFVRTLLTEDYQTNGSSMWAFPVTQKAFDKVKADAMEKYTYTDPETGEEKEQSKGGWAWGDFSIEIYAATPEDVKQIEDIIAGTKGVLGDYEQEVFSIIQQNAAAFFAGDKTAETVAREIQSSVAIYISEQG